MNSTTQPKNVLLYGDIYNQLAVAKQELNFSHIDDISEGLNKIAKSFLSQHGIPSPNKVIDIKLDPQDGAIGVYSPKRNTIEIFANEIKGGNCGFLFVIIHEATHLMQNLIIKNNTTRDNIDNLTLKQYKNMCTRFFDNKNLIVTNEHLNAFKDFVKNESFFEKNQMRLLYEDVIKYNNTPTCYFVNTSEIMADTFALKELNTFLKNHITEFPKNQNISLFIEKKTKNFELIEPSQKHNALKEQDKTSSHFKRNKCHRSIRQTGLPFDIIEPNKLIEKNKQDLLKLCNEIQKQCSFILETTTSEHTNTKIENSHSIADEILSNKLPQYNFISDTQSIDLFK